MAQSYRHEDVILGQEQAFREGMSVTYGVTMDTIDRVITSLMDTQMIHDISVELIGSPADSEKLQFAANTLAYCKDLFADNYYELVQRAKAAEFNREAGELSEYLQENT